MALTDTHCHLDLNLFDADREEVIDRATQAGLVRMLNPGIDIISSQNALELAEGHPPVYAAVGIHPNESAGWDESTLHELESLAAHSKVVAIGEIGLDYYRDRAPRDVQIRVFQEQLALAGRLGLPVIIHNREASQDVLRILAAWQVELASAGSALAECPGVLHSFAADLLTAREAVRLNFLIGITGPVTFKNATALRQTVSALELDRLLIETDSPFLTPQPHRGERNEPALVSAVANKLAEIFTLPDTTVASKTTENASRLFHW